MLVIVLSSVFPADSLGMGRRAWILVYNDKAVTSCATGTYHDGHIGIRVAEAGAAGAFRRHKLKDNKANIRV